MTALTSLFGGDNRELQVNEIDRDQKVAASVLSIVDAIAARVNLDECRAAGTERDGSLAPAAGCRQNKL